MIKEHFEKKEVLHVSRSSIEKKISISVLFYGFNKEGIRLCKFREFSTDKLIEFLPLNLISTYGF